MARLPQPGGDSGTWGQILNDFLSQTHNADGTLKSGTVTTDQIASSTIINADISASAAIDQTKIANLTTDLASKPDKTILPIRFAAAVAITGVTPTDRAYAARTLTGARMRVASAPSGSALIADIQHYNGSSWTTIGTVTIASGSVVESVSSFSQVQVVGDLLRLTVTSIGSSTAATGVVVDVLWA